MKYESASEQGPYLLQLWYTRGCENFQLAEKLRSREHDSAYGQLIIR